MKTKILFIILCFFMIKANGQTPEKLCEFINNRGFENGASCGTVPPSVWGPFGQMANWFAQSGSPDVFSLTPCNHGNIFQLNANGIYGSNTTTLVNPPTSSSNNYILGLECTQTNNEAIMQQMAYSFVPNKRYRIIFKAKMGDQNSYYSGGNPSSRLVFYSGISSTSNPPPAYNAGATPLSNLAGLYFLNNIEINTTNYNPTNPWVGYNVNFTFTGATAHNCIFIGAELLTGQTQNYTYLDDISIEEVPEDIIGSHQLCVGATTTLTSNTPNGVWSSSNNSVATIGSTGVVTAVGIGTTTTKYRVNNLTGSCDGIAEFDIIVSAQPIAPIITSPNPTTYCQNATAIPLTATGIGGATFNWTPSNTPITTTAGTFNYTVTQTVNGCTSVASNVSVIINPSPASITGIFTVCVGSTTTLASATPNGTWSSNNTAVATVNASGVVSGLTAGTATIKYLVGNCFVTQNIIVDPCNPCIVNYNNATPISGTAPNNTLNGGSFGYSKLKIDQNIIIDGTVTFSACEVIMAPNVSITVLPNAHLNIFASHFYTCSSMWQGINVMEGGILNISGWANDMVSLIEDADVAVNFSFPNGTVTYAGNFLLNTHYAVFNRNRTSIRIENYQSDINGNTTYPFFVNTTAFTSRGTDSARGIPIINWTMSYYDFIEKSLILNWNIPTPPLSLQSPLISDILYPDNVTSAFLKTPSHNEKPSFGIQLLNIGNALNINAGISLGMRNANIPIETSANNSGSNLPRSSAEQGLNIFDNLDIGISAITSNLHVTNSIFQKPHTVCSNKTGIYASNYGYDFNGMAAKTSITVNNEDESGNPTELDNAFFDLNYAVFIDEYTNINVNGCHIRSNQNINTPNGNGVVTGIFIQGQSFEQLNIESNKITNIDNAIYLSYWAQVVGADGGWAASIGVNGNIIKAKLDGIVATGNEFIGNAITLEGCTFPNVDVTDPIPLICNENKVSDAFYGIAANNWVNKSVSVTNNQVTLVQIPNDPNPQAVKYGVALANGNSSASSNPSLNFIRNNEITGNCLTCEQAGVYLINQESTDVGCNTVSNLRHGLKFSNDNTGTQFWDNQILPTNQFGFTLDNGGYIGFQGFKSQNKRACTSDNNWQTSNIGWQNLGHFKTNIQNSIASQSKLFVQNNAAMNPNGSGNSNGGAFFPYRQSPNPVSIVTATPTPNLCEHCVLQGARSSSNTEEDLGIIEDIADGSIELPNDDAAQRLYVLQEKLYEELKAAGSKYANNITLQNFMQSNSWGSFDFIYYTQKYLEKGDLSTVDLLLNFFPINNIVDDNYYKYYDIVAEMKANSNYLPNAATIFNIAKQCPAKHGKVVFAARVLYNKLTKRVNSFSDDCDIVNVASRGVREIVEQPKGDNNFTFYPNPASDAISIKGNMISEIEICDIMGRTVLKQKNANAESISINIANLKVGIYIVKATSISGNSFTKKLIKQ